MSENPAVSATRPRTISRAPSALAGAVAALQRCAHECGRLPAPVHWTIAAHVPDDARISALFGSWQKALEYAGIVERPTEPRIPAPAPRQEEPRDEARILFFHHCALCPGPGVVPIHDAWGQPRAWLCAGCTDRLSQPRVDEDTTTCAR